MPHCFWTHAMQALPLAGLLADSLQPARAGSLVWLATSLWVLLVGATFVQALNGLPLLAL